MAGVISWAFGLGLIGLVVWATVGVAGGRGRIRSRRKGGFQMMALMMFGLGSVLDPPQRHVAEAKDEAPKGSPESGEPETDDQASAFS